MARDIAAFDVAEIAVLDGLEDLRLGAQDGVFRFRDVAVDHGGEGADLLSARVRRAA